eukprot:3941385-Rhodomonas_salina.3
MSGIDIASFAIALHARYAVCGIDICGMVLSVLYAVSGTEIRDIVLCDCYATSGTGMRSIALCDVRVSPVEMEERFLAQVPICLRLPTPCPVLISRRDRHCTWHRIPGYAMSGTDIAYAVPICLRASYAMPAINTPYAATYPPTPCL